MKQAFFFLLGLALLCPFTSHAQSDNIPTEQNGLYGVLGSDGKTLIPFEYQSLEQDPAGDGNYIAQKGDKFGLVNLKNEIVLPFEFDRLRFNYNNPLLLEGQKGDKWAFGKLGLPFQTFEYSSLETRGDVPDAYFAVKNGKLGSVDINGKVLLPFEYDELHTVSAFPELLAAKKDGKWGFIKTDGSVHMELAHTIKVDPAYVFRFDGNMAYFDSTQIFLFGKNGKYGGIDCQNKVHIPFVYDDLEAVGYAENPLEQRYFAQKDGKYGIIDAKNKVHSSFRFTEFIGIFKSYGILSKDGKNWLFVNEEGRETPDVSSQITDIDTINGNHFAFVQKDKKMGMMSPVGKFVIEPQYESLWFLSSRLGVLLYGKNGEFGLVNTQGKELTKAIYDEINNGGGYDLGIYKVRVGKLWGLIKANGDPMIPLEYDECEPNSPDDAVIKVMSKGKYGLLSLTGEVVVPLECDNIDVMCGRGHCLLEKNGKYGYTDCFGKELTPIHFDDYANFMNHDIAPIKKDGKYGYLNRQGVLVAPIKYDSAGMFDKTGFASVVLSGKKGKINRAGKEFWQ